MPIPETDLQNNESFSFKTEGEVSVQDFLQSSSKWMGELIPLDGRCYHCSGKIILRTGQKLEASFVVRTWLAFTLDQESVICRVKAVFYHMHEVALYDALGVSKQEALPYCWLPDRPLDCPEKGPYKMDWGVQDRRNIAAKVKPQLQRFSLRSHFQDHPLLTCGFCMTACSLITLWITGWTFAPCVAVGTVAVFTTLILCLWER